MPAKRLVLDTGALIKGLMVDGASTTPEALAEARSRMAGANAEALLSRGLEISSPTASSLARVLEAAKGTGDASALSATDAGLLALALDLCAELVTDDYAVQNTAARLGVQVKTLDQRGIVDELVWAYRCTGCRRRYPADMPDCPVCGATLKKVPSGRKKAKRETPGA